MKTLSSLVALVLVLALGLNGARAAGPQAERRTTRDQEALAGFDFYLGRWLAPGDEPEHGLDFAWGIEGKSVHVRELARVDGELEVRSTALVGWHYGAEALVYHEFVRDSRPFEVVNVGRIAFEPGDVMVRTFTSFGPGGASRDWRERFTPDGIDAWVQRIEYRDDDGTWKPWGTFRGLRE